MKLVSNVQSEGCELDAVTTRIEDLSWEGFPSDPRSALQRIESADNPASAVVDTVLVAYAAVEEYQRKTQERIEQARRYRDERDHARLAAEAYESELARHGIALPDVPDPPTRVTHLSETQALPAPIMAPLGGMPKEVSAIQLESPSREPDPEPKVRGWRRWFGQAR